MTALRAKQTQGPSFTLYFDGISLLLGPFTDVLGNPLDLTDPSLTVVFYIWSATGAQVRLGQQTQLFTSASAPDSSIEPHPDGTLYVFLGANDIAAIPANSPCFYQVSASDGVESNGIAWGELVFVQ